MFLLFTRLSTGLQRVGLKVRSLGLRLRVRFRAESAAEI